MRLSALLLLIGCGRVDMLVDARDTDVAVPDVPMSDTPMSDAPVPDTPMPDAVTLPDGLVAWYPMDTAANGTVRDATGHGHDATCDVAACPLLTTEGRIGNAYAFDGLDDLLRVPPAAVFDSSSSFTVTAWIARGSGNPDGCLIGKILGSDFGNSWQACVGASGLLTFYSSTIVNNVTIDHPQDSNLLAELQWYHIALWSDGGTKATYIGGLLVKSEELPCVFDQNPITIGGDIDSGMPTVLFRGRIDDVQIYNRALTPAELQALAEVK